MRVALLAESFLPHMNGVTGSVLHVLRHLRAQGHETLVIAPRAGEVDADLHGARSALLRSVPLPSYPEVRVVFARTATLTRILREFGPDVIHLASPFVLGWQGVQAADALRVPSVAVYQTDVTAYAQKYGVAGAAPFVGAHVGRLHRRATLTLAPSSSARAQLEGLGVDRIRTWARGVDAERFTPERRDDPWRARAGGGRMLVGYAGRLAAEKQVEDLRALADLPGVRLVVIGEGPARARLEELLPDALFTGFLGGEALARALASLDVFVHPGEHETFCQGVQEALASGVPVVATGRGGPLDLVRSSIDGWLYRPGDLGDLRSRVADLVGDEAKRAAFARAARESVRGRTWAALGDQLLGHYAEARALRPLDDARLGRGLERPALPVPPSPSSGRRCASFVALGDSLTEGLCDTSRMPPGQYRGWADRLAQLLAHAREGDTPLAYANLAVRSRRVRDLVDEQLPMALALRPDLVSVFIGANDLVGPRADVAALAAEVASAVRTLRAAGSQVLLVTPVLPRRRASVLFVRRFARYSSALRRISRETGCLLLDAEAMPELADPSAWADDRVHLSARGHRVLAYRAADVLGVPDADALGGLDDAFHAVEDAPPEGSWLRVHALPWVWRRLRGRTAGDGLGPKHNALIALPPRSTRVRDAEPHDSL
ncbi:MAG: glycosyl transferase [Microbacterium sp.]|uniref:GDSL-type esterase/lipase family protein n=1 Tax=Microbacterium sp. TaxID=51671 RepID=UPI000DB45C89|nr:GDSL-type esterase/lipase family protein [Microbacterium sp.]PZU39495.1 MAG: glycosyl transferase [Microbacterium sp.]